MGIDGTGGAITLFTVIANLNGYIDEDEPKTKRVLDIVTVILFVGNFILVGIYGKFLFNSMIPSKDSATFSIDMIMSTIECILVLNLGVLNRKKAKGKDSKKEPVPAPAAVDNL